MINISWLIPVLPLLGFIIIGLLNKRISVNIAGAIASAMILGSFLISCSLFFYTNSAFLSPLINELCFLS